MIVKPLFIFIISLLILIVLGFTDYYTSYEIGFFIFYFIPVSITAWFAGKRLGIIMGCLSAISWYISDLYSHHPYSKAFLIYWETFIRLISFLTTAWTVALIKQLKVHERHLNNELEKIKEELSRLKNDI